MQRMKHRPVPTGGFAGYAYFSKPLPDRSMVLNHTQKYLGSSEVKVYGPGIHRNRDVFNRRIVGLLEDKGIGAVGIHLVVGGGCYDNLDGVTFEFTGGDEFTTRVIVPILESECEAYNVYSRHWSPGFGEQRYSVYYEFPYKWKFDENLNNQIRR